MKTYFLIMNPGSRSGKSKKSFQQIHDFFTLHNLPYDYAETQTLDDAQRLSVEASQKGYKKVVAVGGDGTINQVISGLYKNNQNEKDVYFGVIYTGTSPDFCKSFGIPITLSEALQVILLDHKKSISLGSITYALRADKKHTGQKVDQTPLFASSHFACCANIGIGADLAKAANSGVRGVIGDVAGTFFSLLRTLFSYKATNLSIEVAGQYQEVENVHNISIGKTHYIASGIKIKHDLSLTDDRFYSLMVKELSPFRLPKVLSSIYSGKVITNSASLSFSYLKSIDILGDGGLTQVEFDGDPKGYLPCRITTEQNQLTLITGD